MDVIYIVMRACCKSRLVSVLLNYSHSSILKITLIQSVRHWWNEVSAMDPRRSTNLIWWACFVRLWWFALVTWPQVPLFIPVVFCITCFFMVFMSLYSDPVNTGIGFAISLTGVPAYYIFIYFDQKPKWLQTALGKSSKAAVERVTTHWVQVIIFRHLVFFSWHAKNIDWHEFFCCIELTIRNEKKTCHCLFIEKTACQFSMQYHIISYLNSILSSI